MNDLKIFLKLTLQNTNETPMDTNPSTDEGPTEPFSSPDQASTNQSMKRRKNVADDRSNGGGDEDFDALASKKSR